MLHRDTLLKGLLILFGIGMGTGLITLFAPHLVPQDNQRMANIDMGEITFTVGLGDIFVAQHGTIAPPPNPDEVLSQHTLAWDSDGFRLPARPADSYDVLALGDSYTEAANVALPWSDVLAQESNQAVKNLGFRGYGPQEEARVMEVYGTQYSPDVVVVGFFGGNDVSNAGSYDDRADDFRLPEIARDAVSEFNTDAEPWNTDRESYQYPVTVDLNGDQHPIVFVNSYVSWLNITQDDLRRSANLAAIRWSWQRIAQAADPSTCFVIAYFPSKPHIYLPYIVPEDRHRIIDGQIQRVAESQGDTIERADIEPTWEALLTRRNNTAQVLQTTAQADGYSFIDLTPHFARAAAQGDQLYYTYDSHWNQAGHNLAGTVLAEAIQRECGSNSTS